MTSSKAAASERERYTPGTPMEVKVVIHDIAKSTPFEMVVVILGATDSKAGWGSNSVAVDYLACGCRNNTFSPTPHRRRMKWQCMGIRILRIPTVDDVCRITRIYRTSCRMRRWR